MARHGSGRWRFHSRFEARVVVALLAWSAAWSVGGCGDAGPAAGARPVARVGDEVLDRTVVEHLAARDAVGLDQARAQAIEVLQIVADARTRRAAIPGERPPELGEARRAHLLRGARARLWLRTNWEPRHDAAAIGDDDPDLVKARSTVRNIHPRIHVACQIVLMPLGEADPPAMEAIVADPQWRARARAHFDPIRARMTRNLPVDDPDACVRMSKLLRFEHREHGEFRLQFEAKGFDLDACAEPDDAGGCKTPALAPEWVQPVGEVDAPGFTDLFPTRFGMHLVFVKEIREPRSLDDPDTDAYLRDQVLTKWRQKRFAELVDQLTQKRTVRIARESSP